jgi:hypothetical protein
MTFGLLRGRTLKVCPVLWLIVAVFAVSLGGAGESLAKKNPRDARPAYREGVVLLAFQDGTQQSLQSAVLSKVGAREIKRIGVGVHVVAVARGRESEIVKLLRAHQEVRYAEPDYLQTVSAGTLPNDTSVGIQWAFQNTGQRVNGTTGTFGADERAFSAWGITTGTNSVVAADLDTGVQYSHPDLFTNMWNNPGGIGGCAANTHGFNVLNNSCDPMDDDGAFNGHGTHVAGIMGATTNNAAGVAGLNWTASIMALKWVNSGGTGATSDLISAMDWVVTAKQAGVNVRVANDSQTWPGTAFSQALSDEIDLLGSNDILFVAASGNTAQNNDVTPRYPCSYARPTMICAAASNSSDNLWSSANFGPRSVQLAAPGVNIFSTLRSSNYGYISGGSMAAAQVSGAAALILSVGYQPVATLRSMILNNVDVLSSLSGLVGTGGRLNICKAIPGCYGAVAGTLANSGLPVVTSIPVQGGLLGASTGRWTGIPSTYKYQWNRCDTNGLNCVAIPGATGQTYAMLAPADTLATLSVTVTASNSSSSRSAQSAASGSVSSATSPSAINSSITNGASISGLTNWTVSPVRFDQFVQFYIDGVLKLTDTASPYTFTGSLDTTTLPNGPHVLGARALFTDNRTYDFYGQNVTVANPPQNTSLPVISGTVSIGQTISTSNGVWNSNAAPTGFAYNWEHCDSSGLNCSIISGATASTYLLSNTDGNFTMRSSVTASNSFGSTAGVSAQTIVVLPPPVTITTTSLPNADQNASYTATLAATAGTPPYTWAITSGTLPVGLTLTAATGVISGLPTAAGTSSFTVQVTDSKSVTNSKSLSITVALPPSVTTTSLPSGPQFGAYSATLAATSGTSPYSWSIASGTLPTGLALASSTGVISGTPTVAGTSNFTVQVTDSYSQSATQALSITILVAPTVTTTSLPGGAVNSPYSATLAATSGTPPYSWSLASGVLPSGLTLAAGTGVISGTPTATGTSSFTVRVTDSNAISATKALSITVASALVVTTTSLPGGTQNVFYSATLAATGGTLPYTWSIASGALPAGLVLATSSGAISGLPSGTGTSNFTVQVTGANGAAILKAFSITVAGTSSGNGIALVQANAAQGSSVKSLSVAFPISNTVGNLIIAFVRMSTSTQTVALADSAGNPYIEAVGQLQTSDGSQSHLFYAKNILGAPNTVTATFSSTNSHPWLAVFEYRGLNTSSPLDQTSHALGSSTTPNSGVTPTTSSATELVFSGLQLAYNYQGTETAGSGYTLVQSDTGSSPASTESMVVTTKGSYSATYTLSSSANWSALVATFIGGAVSVTTSTLPDATQDGSYNSTLAAIGGTSPYSWSITSGTLPAGLSLASSTGVISGTPTIAGTSNFTVQVTDTNSLADTKALSLTVVAPPTVTTASLPGGTQNANYSATLAATGGILPYTWSVISGALPTGLSLSSSSGTISGLPTTAGTSSFTVQVSDVHAATGTQSLNLTVAGPPSVTTTSLPSGTQNTAYSATLAATGGTLPYTWSLSSGTLPAGLSLASSTGVISGTPTGSGTSNFTVQVTDFNSVAATQALSLIVVVSPTVTTTSLPGGTQNAPYTTTLAAAGGTPPYTWAVISGTLPAGLSLAPSTGVISGTPTGTGTNSFTVQVTDNNSQTGSKALTLAVAAPPSVATTSLAGATETVAYSATLAATGGTLPYSWSITSGTLPAGLALAASTGVISGTPTSTGTSSFTVQVSDANSAIATQALSLSVVAPPAVTTTSLPGATQNSAYSATLAATGGTTPYSWSIASGTLPAGLSLASGTGVISGTPTGTGTSNFTVRVTDANSVAATHALSLTVVAPPSVTTSSLPSGTQNTAYNATLAATGGTLPYTWSITSGILPTGLSLDSSTGVISGTPTGTGTSNFTVQVTDANSLFAQKALSLTIASTPPPSVTNTSLPGGTQNVAYNATLAATGGTSPYSWSISAGTLPAGLTLAASTGVISGTPTGTGTSSFTVQVTDANSLTGTKALGITVIAPPSVTTTSLPGGTQNVAYNATLAATGGTLPYSWSITSGILPAGLTLTASTGVISGTPTGTGTSNLTVQVSDANSLTATKTLSLTVVAPPSVTTASLPGSTQNVAYNATLAATGGTSPYSWSISVGTLPAGLTLAAGTGVISGTPTGTGTSNFTVQVTDANSVSGTRALSITVVAPPTVTTTSLPSGTQNAAYSATLTATGGTLPYSWSISVGTLPAGLTLAASTGVISGTPTGTGTSNFTVQVTDANSLTGTKALSLTINASSGGGIGLVQANALQGSAVASLSAAFPVGNTPGNLIIAFVRMSTSTQTVALTDTAGNIYTQAAAQVQTADGSQVQLFYAKNILGAANTVKATFSASNNHPWLAIYEYKGLNTVSPLDQVASAQGSSTTPSSGATPTTTSASELVFAGFGFPASYTGTQTAGAGFTMVQNNTGTSPGANESMLTTATGSYTGALSLSSSANWSAIVATFKP